MALASASLALFIAASTMSSIQSLYRVGFLLAVDGDGTADAPVAPGALSAAAAAAAVVVAAATAGVACELARQTPPLQRTRVNTACRVLSQPCCGPSPHLSIFTSHKLTHSRLYPSGRAVVKHSERETAMRSAQANGID